MRAVAALALAAGLLCGGEIVRAQPAASVTSPAPAAIVSPTTSGDPWTSDELAALGRDLDAQLSAAAVLRGAHLGVLAIDTRDATTLYARNADDLFQPASTFKLLIGSAILDRLGAEARFRTSAAFVPSDGARRAIRNGVLRGALVIHGGGDPLLRVTDIDQLAIAVVRAGVKKIRGPIVIDASRYDDAPYPTGWTWDDFTYDYAAKTSALAIQEDVVHLHVSPGSFAGQPAKVSFDPPVLRLGSSVVTLPRGAATSANVEPDPFGRLHLGGGIALGAGAHAIDAAVPNPRAYIYKVVLARLRAHGVQVAPGPGRRLHAGSPASTPPEETFWSHYSAPLGALLPKFWIPSDNFVGEMFLKELGFVTRGGPGSTAKGIAHEKHWLASLGIDLSTVTLADGCGMSQYDRVTPRDLVTILQHDWSGPYRDVVLAALPVGGSRGTIEGIAGTAAAGRVFAKTGSMMHVRGLAGYLATQRHGAVTFAFSVDDFNGDPLQLAVLRANILARIVGD